MKKALVCIFSAVVAATVFAEASVVEVVARQQWPWNKLVRVEYRLADVDASVPVDIAVRVFVGEKEYSVMRNALSGDVDGVTTAGPKVLWLDPEKITPDVVDTSDFRVELEAVPATADSRLYMVVDLSAGPEASFYPVTYTNEMSAAVLVAAECRTTQLWMRLVRAGSFKMGTPSGALTYDGNITPSRTVSLTRDYYIGVFEITQKQWELVMGANPAKYQVEGDGRPVESVSYSDIRGAELGTNWPVHAEVDAASFMGRLRARTGYTGFDLPTSAQWECAARAGKEDCDFADGESATAETDDSHLNGICRGWYSGANYPSGTRYNAQTAPADGASAVVGSYTANAWGLYDVHGNVQEHCLDRIAPKNSIVNTGHGHEYGNPYENPVGAGMNSVGAGNNGNPYHVVRGGGIGAKETMRYSLGYPSCLAGFAAKSEDYGLRAALNVKEQGE